MFPGRTARPRLSRRKFVTLSRRGTYFFRRTKNETARLEFFDFVIHKRTLIGDAENPKPGLALPADRRFLLYTRRVRGLRENKPPLSRRCPVDAKIAPILEPFHFSLILFWQLSVLTGVCDAPFFVFFHRQNWRNIHIQCSSCAFIYPAVKTEVRHKTIVGPARKQASYATCIVDRVFYCAGGFRG